MLRPSQQKTRSVRDRAILDCLALERRHVLRRGPGHDPASFPIGRRLRATEPNLREASFQGDSPCVNIALRVP